MISDFINGYDTNSKNIRLNPFSLKSLEEWLYLFIVVSDKTGKNIPFKSMQDQILSEKK